VTGCACKIIGSSAPVYENTERAKSLSNVVQTISIFSPVFAKKLEY